MKTNPLKQLETLGQAIWLDYIKQDLFTTDKLKTLITEDGLRGITSNPTIFEKAVAEGHSYDSDIQRLINEGKTARKLYEALTLKDVQDAADELRSVYDRLQGKDGFVSLEVNPHLAYDTAGTIEEAQHLWNELNRPNVFIKVPATKEGLPAITQLISEGINVNVTLLFGVTRYKEVTEAYIAGIKQRIAQGKSVKQIASVASFFLSRIDTLLDPILQEYIDKNSEQSKLAKELQGQIAIASAKIAYQIYIEKFNSPQFKKLAEKGTHPQRLVWASTSTKNPSYSDIKYVEALIGPDTVNTLPLATIDNYRDHGNPKLRLNLEIDKAKWLFDQLQYLNIKIDKITQQLEDEGVDKFSRSYDQLIETLNGFVSKLNN